VRFLFYGATKCSEFRPAVLLRAGWPAHIAGWSQAGIRGELPSGDDYTQNMYTKNMYTNIGVEIRHLFRIGCAGSPDTLPNA
jgi:hypothetical protein